VNAADLREEIAVELEAMETTAKASLSDYLDTIDA
jgi:hypothetical protein